MRAELQSLARMLWETGVVQVKKLGGDNPFGFRTPVHQRHPNAPLAPLFINTHPTRSTPHGAMTPEIADVIGSAMAELAVTAKLSFTVVAGIPRGAALFAEVVARVAKPGRYPVIRFEKSRTEDGPIPTIAIVPRGSVPGDNVLLVHDVLGTGELESATVAEARREQLIVEHLITLVDYERDGGKALAANKVQCHALFTLADLLLFYVQEGKITADMAGFIQTYFKVWV